MNPTPKTWDKEIELAEQTLDHLRRQRAIFENIVPPPDLKHKLIVGNMPRLTVYRFEDLHAARALLREAMGSWEDKLDHRWYACGRTMTSWRNPNTNVELWLECPVEEYPAELQSEHCQWKPDGHRSVEYAYVCRNAKDKP